jgi:hypothetical protein
MMISTRPVSERSRDGSGRGAAGSTGQPADGVVCDRFASLPTGGEGGRGRPVGAVRLDRLGALTSSTGTLRIGVRALARAAAGESGLGAAA